MTNNKNLWADITTTFLRRCNTNVSALKIRTLANRALSRLSPASSPSSRPSRRINLMRTSPSNRLSCKAKSKQCLLRLISIRQIKMKRNHFLTNRKKRPNLLKMAKVPKKFQRTPPLRREHPAKSRRQAWKARGVRAPTALNLTTR